MRVLYFSDNTSGHNRRFLEKFSASGLDVLFLDPTSEHPPEDWLPQGVRWIRSRQKLPRNGKPSEFAAFRDELRGWLDELRPDLVHAGPTHACGYAMALTEFHPWLLMSWGSDVLYFVDQGSEWRQATEFALASADSFFCDCDTVRARAKQLAKISEDHIVQLPWGIEKDSFFPEGPLPEKGDVPRGASTRVVISTRSWEQLYGIDVLLEGFHRAYTMDSSLRLLLLGNGPDVARVDDFIAGHGLAGVIYTPGNVSRQEMPKWFRAADIYISCTVTDGTSISLLEAMATGLPVVVSDLPGNREWVAEEQNGWLARPHSVEDFADRLLRASRLSPLERKQLAERNRRIVEERADWDRNFPKLLKMYEQLVDSR
jgi:L-malate glycosyltransferase